MFTVKISTNFEWKLERQTPGNCGVWGNCRFIVNQDVEECDFWVVIDGVTKKESTRCPSGNTLLITGEPPDVKGYGRRFLAQFDSVITCNRSLVHPRICYSHQGLPWMIGVEWNDHTKTWGNYKTIEELAEPVMSKTRLLSVIASTKDATKGHSARSRFIEKLREVLGGDIDVYGHGRNQISDKWDAIAPYRYHLVIENSSIRDYWTEKLADAFIGEAFPIYHGCVNIIDYFDRAALEMIDINNEAEAIQRIIKIVKSGEYSNKREMLVRSKNKILNEYNVFNMIDAWCTNKQSAGKKRKLSIVPDGSPGMLALLADFLKTRVTINSRS